ncbi:MAG: hypothetical protein DRR16_13065 [Candidatus Parabeggiatoa sp. nov. 3]|nr:MAG: hypothetical protein DRR00_20270 [Gammaproteobacteria bacterium]RKZ63588.1 MAG: hypothetical protein DRQ99_16815 [Gammaproteobacteria bacterium]RKZ85024.1 MAG: hypothetical protein DRR16_13065 [Gammaproteobacteria bacterium]
MRNWLVYKYNTAGFQLLSPTTIMNIESLRDDPTAKQLIELLFPDKLAAAKADGKTEGIAEATENFIHRFGNTLSEEQIKQVTS